MLPLSYLLTLAAITVLTYIFIRYRRWQKKWESFNSIPGPKGYPLFGNILDLLLCTREERWRLIYSYEQNYGRFYKTNQGPAIPTIHILKPEDAEIIFKSTTIINKSVVYDFVKPWLGEGLLTSSDQNWFKSRKLLTPSFHFQILENFIDVFNKNVGILVNKLKQKKDGDIFDIFPFVTLCALDIICESSMGVSVNAQASEQSEYVVSLYKVIQGTVNRFVRLWLHSDFIYKITNEGRTYFKALKIVQGFTRKVIKDRRESRKSLASRNVEQEETGRKKKKIFMDMMLDVADEQIGSLTDEEIREQVDTFMFEGHDTTTSAISFALFLLANHQDIQQQVWLEQKKIFENDLLRPVTMLDLAEMNILERVIKETLRMFPSVPLISRQLGEDLEIRGYHIPAGSMLLVHIFDLHYDPQHFSNPKKFDPNRFLPENCVNRHPYAYVPFSAGPRNCIGQKFAMLEEKTILSTLVRNFKFVCVDKFEDIDLVYELILRPSKGIRMKIQPRVNL